MFGGLRAILSEVRALRESGQMDVRTLGALRPPGETTP
jgi:hypothetical protein